jgi:acetylornithine/succinyldiaminopimelate/putrescine aminotransferase
MILDEIQPGFGRTGALLIPKLRRRSRYSCNGERNGGGMPVGAFTASSDMMHLLSTNLSWVTLHLGTSCHCVSLFGYFERNNWNPFNGRSFRKGKSISCPLVHPLIQEIRGKGLMLAAMTKSADITNEVILKCQDKGLILFWLLFEGTNPNHTATYYFWRRNWEGCA